MNWINKWRVDLWQILDKVLHLKLASLTIKHETKCYNNYCFYCIIRCIYLWNLLLPLINIYNLFLSWNKTLNTDLLFFQPHQSGMPFLFQIMNLLQFFPFIFNWKLISFLHELSSNWAPHWFQYRLCTWHLSNWNFWFFWLAGPRKLNCFCVRGFSDTVLQ